MNNQNEYETSKGEQITYGEEIQLRHIYSGCYLTLRSNELAKQNGCVKIVLQEEDDEQSNFKFIPSNNLNVLGQYIQYNDNVILSTIIDDFYYFHIAEELQFQKENEKNKDCQKQSEEEYNVQEFKKGLEVNASEIKTQIKVKCYIGITDLECQSKH